MFGELALALLLTAAAAHVFARSCRLAQARRGSRTAAPDRIAIVEQINELIAQGRGMLLRGEITEDQFAQLQMQNGARRSERR